MPWKRDRHELFGGGIYRLVSPDNPEFPANACWDLTNMVYDRANEDPEKMRGYVRLGSTDMGGVVTGLFDFDEGAALVATAQDGKVYEYKGSDFAVPSSGTNTGFTQITGKRWSGNMFYGAVTGKNLLILTSDDDDDVPQRYDTTNGTVALGGSPPDKGKFPVPFGGRMWMAAGETLHYSAADNAEDWTTLGGSFHVDRGSGEITGLYVFMGNLLIFKRRKILRLLPGGSLASTAIRELSSRIGTPSHFSIQEVGGASRNSTLFFMSDTGIQELMPTASVGGFMIHNVADDIKPILDRRSRTNLAQAWATFNEDRGEYYLQYCINDNTPDEGVIGNVALGRKTRWTINDMANKTAGAIYRSSGQELQVIADTSGRVYQMHSGDSRAGAGYRGVFTSASFSQGDRFRMKKYGRVAIDFSTDGSYGIDMRMLLGRSALPLPRGNIDQPSGFGATDGWGTGIWGQAVWGGSITAGQWIRPQKVVRGSFMKIAAETTGANQWFKLNGLGIEYDYRRATLRA